MDDVGRIEPDESATYSDALLEHELRQAMKTEPEIDLFKVINRSLRVKDELANNETIRIILQDMWTDVAEFFHSMVEADTLAGLKHDDPMVVAHKDMQANFRAVAAVNASFKEAQMAQQQLEASDQMDHEQQDAEL